MLYPWPWSWSDWLDALRLGFVENRLGWMVMAGDGKGKKWVTQAKTRPVDTTTTLDPSSVVSGQCPFRRGRWTMRRCSSSSSAGSPAFHPTPLRISQKIATPIKISMYATTTELFYLTTGIQRVESTRTSDYNVPVDWSFDGEDQTGPTHSSPLPR